MDKKDLEYDLLLAMGSIRDDYIMEAMEDSTLDDVKEKDPVKAPAASSHRRRRLFSTFPRWSAAAAAVLCICLLLPSINPGASSAFVSLPLVGSIFRPVVKGAYEVQNEKGDAYVEDLEIVSAGSPNGSSASDESDGGVKSRAPEASPSSDSASAKADDASAAAAGEETPSVRSALSAAQITEEIRQMAQEQVASFEESMEDETGFRTLRFLHETVTDSDRWYSLGVIAYTSSADGFEQVTHFNIDKKTGERVSLASWFGNKADYVDPLSESIKEQMREQMKADSDVEYWIDSDELHESDFKRISPEQDFYIDSEGRLVICFDEMTVAPSYMGCVEFTIPTEVTERIRKGTGTGCAERSFASCHVSGL